MRLTLRTLLAYLDDILEPAQAREIGRKVQSAPLAKELVSRIRDVVRRRRLGAPALEGPESGLDPNVVAEYLDNQLTPAQVAQTERVLLNSEMHLAETASAHQILTLVLGEPVEVLPESRKRMYALGPVQAGEKLIVESDEPTQAVVEPTDRLAVKEPRESAGSNGAAHADTGVELAEYVREQQRSRRWWPLVGIALLIGVFVALQWSGRLTNSGSQEIADNQTNSGNNVSDVQPNDPQTSVGEPSVGEPSVGDSGEPATAAEPDSDANATANVNPTDGPEVAATTPTPSDSNATTEPSAIDAPAPADVPEAVDVTPPADAMDTADVAVAGVEPTDTPNVTILAPPGDDDANEDAAMPAPPPAPVVADEVPAAPKPAPVVLAYDKGNSILLQETIEEGWKLVPDGSELGENIRLAVPRPYVAHFQVGNLPVDVHLAAGSRMSTYAAPDAAMGIRVERGRIVISRRAEDEANGEPISIRIAVNNERWTATLPASAARFAIDATPVPPIRLDKVYEGFPFKVWAVGNEGVVILASSKGEERNIGPEDRVALAGPKSGEVLVEPGQGNNWLVGKDPVGQWVAGPTAPTDIRDATRFAKEFDPEVSISDTMPALLKHERSWMARRAVQCLALTQDYRALVHALAVAEHDEATAEAILGLREWLPLDAEFGEFLKAALAQEFVEDESQSIYQLLWGYDEQHARNLKVSRELVRWLGSDQPAIRRMAYLHVLRLTGQQDEYRPSLTSDRMVSFRKRWERQIDRHGTLLKD